MEHLILEKLDTIERLLKAQTEKPLTFSEAAAYLDVSRSHLYKLTSQNKVPCYRPQGKRLYFAKAELDRWILRNPIKTMDEIDGAANDYLITKK